MEEMDKRIMEVARNAVKEYLERLVKTKMDVFIEEKGGFSQRISIRKVHTMIRKTGEY